MALRSSIRCEAVFLVPLFDGGAARTQVRVQEAVLEQARVNYEATVLTALQDVEDALVALRGERERLVHLQAAADAAGNAGPGAEPLCKWPDRLPGGAGHPAHPALHAGQRGHFHRQCGLTMCACTRRWGAAGGDSSCNAAQRARAGRDLYDFDAMTTTNKQTDNSATSAAADLQALLGDNLERRWWQRPALWLALVCAALLAGGWYYWEVQTQQGGTDLCD